MLSAFRRLAAVPLSTVCALQAVAIIWIGLPFFRELARPQVFEGLRGMVLTVLVIAFILLVGKRSRLPAVRYQQALAILFVLLVGGMVLGNDLVPVWRKIPANGVALGLGFAHLLTFLVPTWIPFVFGNARRHVALHAALVVIVGFCLSADQQFYLLSGIHARWDHMRLLLQPDTATHIGGGGVLFRGIAENILLAQGALLLPLVLWRAGLRDG